MPLLLLQNWTWGPHGWMQHCMHMLGRRRREPPAACRHSVAVTDCRQGCLSRLLACLQTIENTREKDETMVQPDDAEVAAGACMPPRHQPSCSWRVQTHLLPPGAELPTSWHTQLGTSADSPCPPARTHCLVPRFAWLGSPSCCRRGPGRVCGALSARAPAQCAHHHELQGDGRDVQVCVGAARGECASPWGVWWCGRSV